MKQTILSHPKTWTKFTLPVHTTELIEDKEDVVHSAGVRLQKKDV